MKAKYINWFFVAALAVSGCFMTACEDQPDKYEIADGIPTLKYVRSPLPEEADSLFVGAYLGNTICLVGDNLRSIYELYFNDQKATLNTSYMTDHTILVDIPKTIPEEVTDKIYMVTKSGEIVDYDFRIMVPAPEINSMSCEYAPAGSEAVLYGDYFVDDPNIPLTISMPGGVTVEGDQITNVSKTAVSFIVPEGALQGYVQVTSIYGTGQSTFQYKDTRNILFDWDGKYEGALSAGNSWNGDNEKKGQIIASVPPIDGNYLVFGPASLSGGQWQTPGEYMMMYWPDPNASGENNGNDIVYIRYADILLCRAEALNELNGPNAESISLINQVRQRAKVADIVLGDYPTKESLRDFILAERGREFFSEGLRREDLIRHGKFISNAIERGKNAKPYHVLYPIPQRQREANPNLAQNPGYEGAE